LIYFIQNEANLMVKIGYAGSVKSRLRGLRTASPDRLRLIGTIEGSIADEHRLHHEFHRFRGVGEWFKPEAEFIEAVTEMLKGRGNGRPWGLHIAAIRKGVER